MSSLFIKPERLEVVDMVPYIMSGTSVVVAEGNDVEVTGMDNSLCGKRMAAITGTTATVLAEEQVATCEAEGLEPLDFQQVTSPTAGLQALGNGQIDAYADGTPVLLYYLQQREGVYELAGEPFGAIEVGAAVNKGNTELEDAISEAFDELFENGEYDAILEEHNLQDLTILDN
jgi:polar amino acid transport system substrate-binding protein